MFVVILCSLVLAAALGLMLARYAPNPAVRRAALRPDRDEDARPRMSAASLRALVIELLGAIGLRVVEEEVRGDERRLVAVRNDPLQGARYVVFIAPNPPGDVVAPTTVLELAEYVKSEWGSIGLLFTPFTVERAGLAGLEPRIELIDGARLRQLVATHLPARLEELDRHRGFAAAPTLPSTSPPTLPQPVP
jgi:hypothetical protein